MTRNAFISFACAMFGALFLAGAAQAGPDAEQGVVVVAYDGIPQRIHPVMILEIDGTPQPLPLRDTLYLDPGKHTLRLGAKLDDNAGVRRGNWERRDAKRELVLEVEAGKRYVVGAKLTGRTGSAWEPVLVRTEDRGARG